MSIYKNILCLSPWLEIIIKTFYWRSKFVHKILSKKKKRITANKKKYLCNDGFDLVKKTLNSLNLRNKEIMVVHSS
ncbi:hypothetical protein OAL69_01370, partial [Pelagibacteraceae bacterium]|nr:hypothetical protein [Pelagibacteraceae bacterium]